MIISMIAFFATKLTNDANYEMICMSELLQTQPASRFSLLLTTGGFFCFPYSLYPVDLKKLRYHAPNLALTSFHSGSPLYLGFAFVVVTVAACCSGCAAFCSLSGFCGGFWYIKDGLRLMLSIGLFCSCILPPLLVNYDDRASCILPSPVLSGLSIKKVSPNGDT